MKTSRNAIFSLALIAAAMTALPATSAFAEDAGAPTACDAARAGNNFTAWFYRTFLC